MSKTNHVSNWNYFTVFFTNVCYIQYYPSRNNDFVYFDCYLSSHSMKYCINKILKTQTKINNLNEKIIAQSNLTQRRPQKEQLQSILRLSKLLNFFVKLKAKKDKM